MAKSKLSHTHTHTQSISPDLSRQPETHTGVCVSRHAETNTSTNLVLYGVWCYGLMEIFSHQLPFYDELLTYTKRLFNCMIRLFSVGVCVCERETDRQTETERDGGRETKDWRRTAILTLYSYLGSKLCWWDRDRETKDRQRTAILTLNLSTPLCFHFLSLTSSLTRGTQPKARCMPPLPPQKSICHSQVLSVATRP